MSKHEFIVPEPNIVDRPYKKPLFCGPGPCDFWPSVIEAFSKPLISPGCDEYFQVVSDIRAGCKYLFQTKSDFVLAVSGAGHAGMEAVITNLVAPGEIILIAARGMWDARANIIATRHGCKVEMVKCSMETTFSLEYLETHLKRLRPTALYVTHGDSSTGTVQNMEGLGDLCHKYGALLLVDCMVSIGGVPFLMDAWGVDAVFGAAQKALSGPAGICAVAFSKKAEEVINNRTFEPQFYLDCKILAQNWCCFGDTRGYHHTLSPPMLWALRACLKEISKETLSKTWARHKKVQLYFHARLQKLGFDLMVPKPEDRLPTVTLVTLPKGYDYNQFIKYLRNKHNIEIFPGRGPTVGKALRIGHMGINATIKVTDMLIEAMVDARKALTKSSL